MCRNQCSYAITSLLFLLLSGRLQDCARKSLSNKAVYRPGYVVQARLDTTPGPPPVSNASPLTHQKHVAHCCPLLNHTGEMASTYPLKMRVYSAREPTNAAPTLAASRSRDDPYWQRKLVCGVPEQKNRTGPSCELLSRGLQYKVKTSVIAGLRPGVARREWSGSRR